MQNHSKTVIIRNSLMSFLAAVYTTYVTLACGEFIIVNYSVFFAKNIIILTRDKQGI